MSRPSACDPGVGYDIVAFLDADGRLDLNACRADAGHCRVRRLVKDTTAAAGHLVHRVNLSDLAFPDITSREEWEQGLPPPAILNLQDHLARAEHLVIVCPL